MSKLSMIVVVGIVAIAGFVAQVPANEVTFNGFGYKSDVHIRHDGENMYVWAGVNLVTLNGQTYDAFCVDLDHELKNQWSAEPAPATTIDNGLAAAYLYDHFASTVSSNVTAAGLQIAIWEAVSDYGSVNLAAGSFRFTTAGDILTAAQSYLSALPTELSGYTTSSFILSSGDCPRSQNLIVPEPGTMAVLGLSVLPLAAWRRP